MLSRLMSLQTNLKEASFWMPKQASTVAGDVDSLYYFILYLCVIFFVLIMGAMVYFMIKYKKKSDNDITSPVEHNYKLEFAWSIVPTILLLSIFVWGFRGWIRMSQPPEDTMDIRVTAQKWAWSFTYPKDGIDTNELVVPVGTKIRLIMSSKDVLHSFYVPDFRIKRDVLPNRYTVVWFEAPEVGEHNIFCTEYCGTNHSAMLSKVKVVSEEDYKTWVDAGGGMGEKGMSAADLGKMLYEKKGCNACHSIDGTAKIGPTFKGLYGKNEKIVGGSTAVVDDNYIRESVMEPNAKVVDGFPPVMPSFKGQIKDDQVNGIIEYIKTLK